MDLKEWELGKDREVNFWHNWFERGRHKKLQKYRLDRLFSFMLVDKTEAVIANLGAGAVNIVGYHRRDVKIKIISSDLLENEYKKLREKFNIDEPSVMEYQDMLNLTYKDNMFDIVYCANSLDHCPDPEKALREMVRVCKPDGWIYIRHFAHEGRRHGHHGFHQWNLDITDSGDCKIWDKSRSFLLSSICSGFETKTEQLKKYTLITSWGKIKKRAL